MPFELWTILNFPFYQILGGGFWPTVFLYTCTSFIMLFALTNRFFSLFVFSGYFPLESAHCLVWMCLDVLFCTASIMHLCTISIDRYLSLRYPMRFGRNKTRKRVTVKIIFVWILSIAMSLPLSLMYSKVSVFLSEQIVDWKSWKFSIYQDAFHVSINYFSMCIFPLSFCFSSNEIGSCVAFSWWNVPNPRSRI